MARLSTHARRQLETRFAEGFDKTLGEITQLLEDIGDITAQVWIARSQEHHWIVGDSNGDGLAAVVRRGVVCTICLRRMNQSPMKNPDGSSLKVVWA